jgi:hypothetical protein
MAAARAAATEAISSQLAESGMHCEMANCEEFSLGTRCRCGRMLCPDHLYFKISTRTYRPEATCPSCIMDDHPELFE